MLNKKTRIGIVEDEASKLREIKTKINQTDDLFCTCTFETGEDALKGLLKYKPEIVIMDIGLPNMGGIECMSLVKRKIPNMAFLMFTIFSNDENLFDALRFYADGYILKREGTRGIIRAIRSYLEGGAPMSPEIARRVIKSFRAPGVETLTSRQSEILTHLSKGLQNKEIANRLSLTEGTIKVHLHRIYTKLKVNNRTEAINKFIGRENF